MIYEEQRYKKYIVEYFNYLEGDYGYDKPVFYESQYCSYAEYIKDKLMVRIEYSFKNKTIMCTIYNHIDKVKPGKYSWKYSVDVDFLIKRYEQNLYNYKNYLNYMPDKIGLEGSVKKVSELLQEYGHKILTGKEWVSWGEITGDTRTVPDDLP
jgi:hypothetical protein